MSENKLTFNDIIILLGVSLVSTGISYIGCILNIRSIWFVVGLVLFLLIALGIIVSFLIKIKTVLKVVKENRTPPRIIIVIVLSIAILVILILNIFTLIFVAASYFP